MNIIFKAPKKNSPIFFGGSMMTADRTFELYRAELFSAIAAQLGCQVSQFDLYKSQHPAFFRLIISYVLHDTVSVGCKEYFLNAYQDRVHIRALSARGGIFHASRHTELAELWHDVQMQIIEDDKRSASSADKV